MWFRFSQRLSLRRNCGCLPTFRRRPWSHNQEAETGNSCASRCAEVCAAPVAHCQRCAATAERPSVDTLHNCATRHRMGLQRNCGRVSLRRPGLAAEAEGVADQFLHTSSEPWPPSKPLIMSTSSSPSESLRSASAQLETTLYSPAAHGAGGVREKNSDGATWMSDEPSAQAPFV